MSLGTQEALAPRVGAALQGDAHFKPVEFAQARAEGVLHQAKQAEPPPVCHRQGVGRRPERASQLA
eukprot:4448310-Pyramimonas_sp.AAC.3